MEPILGWLEFGESQTCDFIPFQEVWSGQKSLSAFKQGEDPARSKGRARPTVPVMAGRGTGVKHKRCSGLPQEKLPQGEEMGTGMGFGARQDILMRFSTETPAAASRLSACL